MRSKMIWVGVLALSEFPGQTALANATGLQADCRNPYASTAIGDYFVYESRYSLAGVRERMSSTRSEVVDRNSEVVSLRITYTPKTPPGNAETREEIIDITKPLKTNLQEPTLPNSKAEPFASGEEWMLVLGQLRKLQWTTYRTVVRPPEKPPFLAFFKVWTGADIPFKAAKTESRAIIDGKESVWESRLTEAHLTGTCT